MKEIKIKEMENNWKKEIKRYEKRREKIINNHKIN